MSRQGHQPLVFSSLVIQLLQWMGMELQGFTCQHGTRRRITRRTVTVLVWLVNQLIVTAGGEWKLLLVVPQPYYLLKYLLWLAFLFFFFQEALGKRATQLNEDPTFLLIYHFEFTWYRHEDIINGVDPGTLSRIQLKEKETTYIHSPLVYSYSVPLKGYFLFKLLSPRWIVAKH